ncbi:FliH/SctL family protein [Nocardioides panacisoli]|uniref:Flagellar assembly protein FliH/Type III secretion system HrpE domain-containing protein n=1 Tax=Nocardioides panacisoli TaxID=627624 RepID=A0ABP7HST4_9ACTN
MALPELRTGEWTRLGGDSVLGDAVTEAALGGLAERARSAARAQGYAVGWAEGRRQAAAEAAEHARALDVRHAEEESRRDRELAVAVQALGEAAEQVRGLLDDLAASLAAQGTDLAWALAEEIVGRAVGGEGAQDVVARVLGALPAGPVATVRLHPDVASGTATAELAEHGVVVVADPALEVSDALVESDGAVVDLRIAAALERVREVLA